MGENISDGNRRIAKNTLMLYVRQIITLVVSLVTVRLVLKALGEVDYGVNNVVAGAVTMFSFLTGALATGANRFFSYALGKKDEKLVEDTFHATLTIYVGLGVLIFLLGETVGLWFVNNKLVIPAERMAAANWIYQFSLINYFFGILTSPYMASIMAHEDMHIYARYTLVDIFLKLAIVFALYVTPIDRLTTYGFLGMAVAFVMRAIYRRYCNKHYPECTFKLYFSKKLLIEIAGFSGWNLFGNFAWVVKNQGMTFLMNMFFGPVINAAQSIATQIRTVLTSFATNIATATQPQITKNFANGDYSRMFKLVHSSSKFTFFLMIAMAIPVYFNLDYLLNLWLTDVPAHTVGFAKLMLIEGSFEAMSTPIANANQATGRIGLYQFLIGIFGVLNLPLSYIAIRSGAQPEFVYVISIACQSLIILERMVFLEKIQKKEFLRSLLHVLLPCIIVSGLSSLVCHFLYKPSSTFLPVLGTLAYEFVIVAIIAYFVGLNKEEKLFALNYISNLLHLDKHKK